MNRFLDGKVALVTGGSRGIGLAVAARLLRAGAQVVVAARRADGLEQARQELAPLGRVHTVAADVRNPQACRKLVAETVRWGGRLDLLLANAGVGIFKPVAEMSVTDFAVQMETNLHAPFFCVKAALPHLLASQGWVIFIASLAARNPFPGGAAYCASKAGLLAFAHCLMEEVRQQGVRVATVLPGSVDTGFAGSSPGASWKLSPEDVAQGVVDLLAFPPRALPSLLELRPSQPQRR
ncbi:MAG: SDR family oxidoreductase [Thermoanaerobaculum sp.]|nr:SDR family oxidoreductase [Thermoanaerobaculum sp.]MDW7968765.1 SDR family oxidoreductase [Thermoanaerobaculum sp.]